MRGIVFRTTFVIRKESGAKASARHKEARKAAAPGSQMKPCLPQAIRKEGMSKAMKPRAFQPKPPLHLRAWRLERGLSQEALGRAAGCTQGTVSFLEHSDRKPWQATLKRLSDALQVAPEALYFPPAKKAEGEPGE